MVYTKLFSHKISTEKSTGMIFFLALLTGSILGVFFARFQCLASRVCLPPVQELSLAVSQRHLISIIAVDSVFSILLLLSSFAGHRKAFCLSLFFLKGFCISYFIYLFVFFFQAHGFLIAFSVLLLHGFLLLPLQLTSAYLLLLDRPSKQRNTSISVLCISNLAAALLCAVLEYFALPAIFTSHLTF